MIEAGVAQAAHFLNARLGLDVVDCYELAI
jgi:hypothetical protein